MVISGNFVEVNQEFHRNLDSGTGNVGIDDAMESSDGNALGVFKNNRGTLGLHGLVPVGHVEPRVDEVIKSVVGQSKAEILLHAESLHPVDLPSVVLGSRVSLDAVGMKKSIGYLENLSLRLGLANVFVDYPDRVEIHGAESAILAADGVRHFRGISWVVPDPMVL